MTNLSRITNQKTMELDLKPDLWWLLLAVPLIEVMLYSWKAPGNIKEGMMSEFHFAR